MMANSGAIQRFSDRAPPFPVAAATTTDAGREDLDRSLQLAKYREFYGRKRPQAARDDEPNWRADLVRKVVAFTELPQGWDSYNGHPLRADVAQFALTVLNEITQPQTPAPDVVLASDGSLQFEWHQSAIDLEICVTAPYDCEVWFEDHRTGEARSLVLSDDFASLAGPITELGSR